MVVKKRGLGRGLDSLLGGVSAPVEQGDKEQETLRHLPVDLLQRGRYQPRRMIDPESLEELADSIRAQGVVQPIIVRRIGGDRYEIIAGERRWRGAQLAGLHDIPAVVREVPDQAAIAMALIENIQREDLNPIEEAEALRRLIEEFELTQQQAADAVGRSRTAVTNLLRLLSLNTDVRTLVERRELEMGHARALLALAGIHQSDAAHTVVKRGLSVREAESLVRRLQTPMTKRPLAVPDPDIRRLQENLAEKLGTRVVCQPAAKGRGKLIIHYHSLDELDGILAHIH